MKAINRYLWLALPCFALLAGQNLAQAQVGLNPFLGLPQEKSPQPPAAKTPISPPAPVMPMPGKSPIAQPDSAKATLPAEAAIGPVKVARPPEAGPQVTPGAILRFENADIHDIVQAILGDMLRINYLIDPSIQGRVTLQSSGNVSAADVYNILESVLQLHGISIVKDGKIYKVIRDVQANRDALSIAAGENSPVVQIIPLRFVQASALVGTLKSVVGPQAVMINDPTNRHLIVVDRAANVSKVLEMVAVLDVDYLAKVRIRLIELSKGDAVELAKEMDTLFRTSGLFNWSGTEGSKVFFLPITRMNAILVAAANDAMLDAADKWIRTLDDEPKSGMGSLVNVYPVSNSNATHLANLLRQLYGGAPAQNSGPSSSGATTSGFSTATGQTPGLGGQTNASDPSKVALRGAAGTTGGAMAGNVQIIADEATNSLVIRANPQDYLQIRKVIDRIDSVPRQVLIQVMVAEVILSDELQYGVEWWLRNLKLSANGKTWAAQAALDSGLVAPTANPVTSSPGSGVSGGLNYLLFNSAGDITGLFNLLNTTTDVNILSAPHVMASDGKTARIEVGSEMPVVTQTTSAPTSTLTTGYTSNSVQYRPTGIILEVKPSINASGMVNLDLAQEVSARGDSISVGGSSYPSFTKRKVSTEVSIEQGKTLMVAGLIEDSGDKTSQGLPFLKDIPVLGGLFGRQRKVTGKKELLIAITPYVVRNRNEAELVSQSFRENLRDLKKYLDKTKLALPAEPLKSDATGQP